MNYPSFSKLAGKHSAVVLLEGTRQLPANEAPRLTALAAHLARTFPSLRFRTGNAAGSDEAFAAGVASIDPSRLELVVPYSSHRTRARPERSVATALTDLGTTLAQEVVEMTVRASPQYERVAVNYRKPKTHPRQRATAQLLLRDTLKVTGSDSMSRPIAGIFFLHAPDPERGGTGHTMRVCRMLGVPVIAQDDWMNWPCLARYYP